MKKSLLTMAAALALVSCSQDDLMQGIENRPTGAIGVKAYVPTITRGTALNNEGELVKAENGFDLFAFLSDNSQFMGTASDGVAFQGSGTGTYTWNYVSDNEMKFWSEANGSAIKFYAVSPMSEKTASTALTTGSLTKNITADEQTLTYTVPTTCSEQVDLMYAVTDEYASDDESAEHVTNGITLQFRHALSQIVFKAMTENELIYADIESVKITNLNGAGTFNLATAETYREAVDKTTATFPWNYTDEANSPFAAEITETIDINTDAEGATGVKAGKYTTKVTDGAISLTESTEALLLLPQNLEANSSALEISCKVRYKRADDDIAEIVGSTDTYETITVPVETSWQPGYKYTYTLIFTAEMGNPIKVKSVNVDEWNNATEEDGKVEGEEDNEDGVAKFAQDVDNSLYQRQIRAGYTDVIAFTSGSTEEPVIEYSNDGTTYDVNASNVGMDWVTVSPATSNYANRSALNSFIYNVSVAELSHTSESGTYKDALLANGVRGEIDQPWNLQFHNLEAEPTSSTYTANCYVVNAAGYYSFPVVYGNAVDGYSLNEKAFVGGNISSSGMPDAQTAEVLWSTIDGLITDVKVIDESGYDYWEKSVNFKVNESVLDEANAVIVVKNGSGEITWSWHIWVTPVDLTPVVTNSSTNASAMPVNLGWISGSTSNVNIKKYEARSGYVRFTQGGVSFQHKVSQSSHCCVDAVSGGTDVYYQWGRKDPFAIDKYTTNSNGSIENSISQPNVFYTSVAGNMDGGMWYDFTYNYNIWNAGVESINTDADNTVKTIFDPCPLGFAVAPTTAFIDLSDTDGYSTDGFTFSTAKFPLTGWIDCSGTVQNANSMGACWKSTIKNKTWGYGAMIDEQDGFTVNHSNMMMGAAYPVRPVVNQSL